MKRFWRALILGCGLVVSNGSFASPFEYSPKITVRIANGLLQNVQDPGRSSLNLGGLNIGLQYFFSSRWAATFGYKVDFDFGSGTIPLSGFDLGMKYYYNGNGTRVLAQHPESTSDTLDTIGMYGGFEFAHRNYYLGSNPTDTGSNFLTGSFYSFNVLTGIDYRISSYFEANAELNAGLLVFAGTDDRIKVRSILLLVGVSYIW